MSTITKISEGLATAASTGGNSIVRVEARRRLPASGIVWSNDLIVTASHVIRKEKNITIGLANGETTTADLVGRDNTTDIAVLRVADGALDPIAPADADGLAVGQLVLALGRPGQTTQATMGIISALGKGWRTGAGGEIDRYLQTDVLMYPGFSGGALVNVSGELVGLNSSALARGVSVSIPVTTVSRVVESLVSHGKVKQGYLGVSTQAVRLPKPIRAELGQETGLLIANVESGSPAEAGGLLLGDTLVSLDGHAIQKHDDLLGLLQGSRVGNASPVQILRGGELQTVEVVVGERE